ncbi:MAG: TetR/AcrR family transcriptional regulator [bacterium]
MEENNALSGKDHDTRGRIIKAAMHLFAEKGFRGVSVKEISMAAGTNTALLFYYFRNKKELYDSIYRDAQQNLSMALEKALEGKTDAAARLEEVIRFSLENFSVNPDFELLFTREIHGFGEYSREQLLEMFNSAIEPLEQIVSQGIQEGLFRELNPRLAAISIMVSFHPFTRHHCTKESKFTPEEIFRHVREMILGGIKRNSE